MRPKTAHGAEYFDNNIPSNKNSQYNAFANPTNNVIKK